MSALANTRINQRKSNDQADNCVEDDMVEISTTAISVIARIDYIQRFSKQMTVVVEHAHALSLQIKYELCQLADTAKKTQNNINVVIFGLKQAAI